ncbi:MAG: hypothetical protein PHP23_11485 [Desulfobacterales bacterium]|nr:hypothetical protein [Desulfobacterales bacterium]MDD4073856.1 hypothetical protein [Desulfobacterales bacterium]MDD4394039.1 hypothetical protein [Desulfobacterales bacterium]
MLKLNVVMAQLSRLFDQLERAWKSLRLHQIIGTIVVFSYILALIMIEANRNNLIPAPLNSYFPLSHFMAIDMAFTLVLVFEVLGLIFSIAGSVSISVAKQFEILSLILLRDSFKEFSHFSEPLVWDQISNSLVSIVVTATGALLIFTVLGIYYKIQQPNPITKDEHDKLSFIITKKAIAIFLLISFGFISMDSLLAYILHAPANSMFESFYTILIFSDILIVLISIRCSTSYHVAFRNSAYAVATVMIRLALMAPLTICALLGSGAAVFTLSVTFVYNKLLPVLHQNSD